MQFTDILLTFLIVLIFALVLISLLKKPANSSDAIMEELKRQSRDNLDQMQKNREELSTNLARHSAAIDAKLELQNRKIDSRLNSIEEKNEKSIEKVRKTVDENLHKSLEEHIGQSFKTVSERLEQVYKGLGEMQTLATGVGDLKKVLTNVKNRGVWGELQLERLLSGVLSYDQYIKNATARPGSGQVVEFAIKLPTAHDETVLLPIDSKFPVESYNRLLDCYENNLSDAEIYAKELEDMIKKSAKDISEKYINPPITTDFAIMFLPVEGLYCEVVRRDGLIEMLQQKYRVIISGPTTLTALLNSLSMGFKTVALEKRTAQVWATLSAVKIEFDKFSAILDNSRKHLKQADEDIEKLVGVRTRSIISKLDKLEETLPEAKISSDE